MNMTFAKKIAEWFTRRRPWLALYENESQVESDRYFDVLDEEPRPTVLRRGGER